MLAIKPSRITRNLQSFARGQTIFEQGTAGEVMYVVVEGEVDLRVNGELVERVGMNGMLGEMALIDAAPRSAAAVAHTDCRLMPINERKFALLVRDRPEFALQIMRLMAERLRHMDERMQKDAAGA